MMTLLDIASKRILVLPEDGPQLAREGDANDFLSLAWEQQADWLVIPTERLHADFFKLNTRLAGNVIQKFVNYGVKLAIVGDITREVAASKALHDFVYESNKGTATWFVATIDELKGRLGS